MLSEQMMLPQLGREGVYDPINNRLVYTGCFTAPSGPRLKGGGPHATPELGARTEAALQYGGWGNSV